MAELSTTGSDQETGTWQPFRGPFARWPLASDIALAGLFFWLTTFVTFVGPDDEPTWRSLSEIPLLHLFLFAVAHVALIWRRKHPLAVLVPLLAAPTITFDAVYGVVVGIYSLGRYGATDRIRVGGLILCLVVFLITGVIKADPISDLLFAVPFVTAIWLAGRQIGDRGAYLALLQERADTLERKQTAEAARAVAEERTRIARELHDVVAHRVSMMTVQAGAAKTVALSNPAQAVDAMQAVEDAGREALNEMRHLLGVLRPDTDGADLAPQPGLSDVPALIYQFKEAGLTVASTINVPQDDLPAHVDLCLFRVVQEALTNVLKHAGTESAATLSIFLDGKETVVDVSNSGGGSSALPSSGHGITGMRERVELLGGTFRAEPLPDGGFQVTARLPLEGTKT